MSLMSQRPDEQLRRLWAAKCHLALPNLPPEILERFFYYMDEQTYFVALMTCKRFWLAGTSRGLLLQQIRRIPGLTLGLKDMPTSELLKEFRIRATRAALSASALADTQRCDFAHGTIPSMCCMARGEWTFPNHEGNISRTSQYWAPLLLALPNVNACLELYEIQRHDVRWFQSLPADGNSKQPSSSRIIKVSFSRRGDIIVLYERHPAINKLRRQCNASKCPHYDMVMYSANVHDIPAQKAEKVQYRYQPSEFKAPRLTLGEFDLPTGLAVSYHQTEAFVASLDRSRKAIRLDWVHLLLKVEEAWRTVFIQFPSHVHRAPVLHLGFSPDGEKLICLVKNATYHLDQVRSPRSASDVANATAESYKHLIVHGPSAHAARYCYTKGFPFWSMHHHKQIRGTNQPKCNNIYLELATEGPDSKMTYLYILRWEQRVPQNQCTYTGPHPPKIDTDAVRKVVAYLGGWKTADSSMGMVTAATQDGCRIAVADWSRVWVWTIDPSLIIDGSEHYFPEGDYNESKKFGRIRPVALRSQGIVHDLIWVDSECLMAITDRGLAKWYIGGLCSGKHEDDLPAVPVIQARRSSFEEIFGPKATHRSSGVSAVEDNPT